MKGDEPRITWLVQHKELWKGWPSANYSDDVILKRMKKDGVFSAKTHNQVNLSRLIAEARRRT